eukprot:GSChrysophyteH1.ASY1.ANO1.1414.1 assembled CDS
MGFCEDYYTSTDDDIDGFINWTGTYCDAPASSHVLITILVLFALALMMVILGSTADMYFVPALQIIAHLWKLRPDVAGVTLLAFGNGAPDIITAVTGVDAGDFGIVIGNLLGGNNFIQMLVMGAVLRAAGQNDPIVSEKGYIQVDPKAFVRDMSSYIFFILLIMTFSFTGHLHFWHVCILSSLYFIYVAVVIYSGKSETGVYETHLKKRAVSVARAVSKDPFGHSDTSSKFDYNIAHAYKNVLAKEGHKSRQTTTSASSNLADLMKEMDDELENNGDALPGVSLPDDLECCCGVVDDDEHDDDPTMTMIYNAFAWTIYVVEWPFSLARAVSIPTTDLGWGPNKRYFSAISFTGGILCCIVTFFGTDFDSSTYIIATAIGAFFGAWFLFTTSDDEETKTKMELMKMTADINPASPMQVGKFWLWPLIVLAFMSSTGWLNAIAGEAVAASLVVAGASGMSSSVVGLTLLAWGNSIGDYVADVAVCNAGSPYTAVSSCIGSPMLSAIIGICLSVIVNTAGQGQLGYGVPCNLDTNSYVSYAFLLIAQVMTLFVTITNNYRIPVGYYKILWGLYVFFITVVVSIEVSGNNIQ